MIEYCVKIDWAHQAYLIAVDDQPLLPQVCHCQLSLHFQLCSLPCCSCLRRSCPDVVARSLTAVMYLYTGLDIFSHRNSNYAVQTQRIDSGEPERRTFRMAVQFFVLAISRDAQVAAAPAPRLSINTEQKKRTTCTGAMIGNWRYVDIKSEHAEFGRRLWPTGCCRRGFCSTQAHAPEQRGDGAPHRLCLTRCLGLLTAAERPALG